MKSSTEYLSAAPIASLLVALLIAFTSLTSDLRAMEITGYDFKIAAAKSLAAEKSWAKARDAYAEALPLAPDADARRWCELWLEDAAWRGEKQPEWSAIESWGKRHWTIYERLLEPFAKDAMKDDYWRVVLWSRADLKGQANDPTEWDDRLQVIDFLATQPPSTAAVATYIEFLRKFPESCRPPNQTGAVRYLRHLENAARIATSAEDRASFLLKIAQSHRFEDDTPLTVRDQQWQHALTEARGTKWEPLARIGEFNWRLQQKYRVSPPANTPKDGPTALIELADMRRDFQAATTPENKTALAVSAEMDASFHEPFLKISAPSQIHSGEPLSFSYGAANLPMLRASLKLESLQGALHDAIDTESPASEDGTAIREWDITPPDIRAGAWNSEMIEAVPKLAPGLYSLELEGRVGSKSWSDSTKVLVSDYTGMSFTTDNGESQVFVQDARTESPVAHATVEGAIGAEKLPLRPLHTRTDPEGKFLIPALPAPTDDDWRHEAVLAMVNGQPVGFERRVRRPFYHQERLIVDAIFDRPLYRPGETVHWKLIARERRDGKFVAPPNTAGLLLLAELNDITLLDGVPIAFNAFGTSQGEFVIPANAKPGAANFVIGAKKDDDEIRWGGIYDAFQVDNFVPPSVEAKIELAGEPDSLRPGQEMVVSVNASYLSGGPVVGAKVVCDFSYERPYVGNRETENLRPQTLAWSNSLADKPQQGITDASGRAEFRLRLPSDLPDLSWLKTSATILPEGAAEIKADKLMALSAGGYFLDTKEWRDPQPLAPKTDFVFSGQVFNGIQSPTPFQGEARLVELRWTEAWLDPQGHIIAGPELARIPHEENRLGAGPRLGWRKLHAEYAVTPVESQPVSTDAFGRFTSTFKVPREGIFQIRIYRNDALVAGGDRPLKIGPTVFASDANTSSLELPYDEGFVVGPAFIKPGQPLEALAILPEGIKTGWLNFDGEESSIIRHIVSSGRVAHIRIEQPPTLCGFANLKLSWDGQTSWRNRANFRIRLQDDSLALNVLVEPSTKSVRPGSAATATFKVTDHKGNPVETELGFTTFDEALTQLLHTSGRIASPTFLEAGKTVDVERKAIGDDAAAAVPEIMRDPRAGLPDLDILHPDRTETRDIAGYSAGEFCQYTLSDTKEESIVLSPFEVSTEKESGYQVSKTLAGNRLRTDLKDVSTMKGIDGYDPHVSIQIRRHFSSTAFWAPDLVTNEKGEATVSFQYPDNLTQWRLEAFAVGADGNSFGRAATFTRTSLPFQARLQLPRFLVAGDTAEPSALLLNRTDGDFTASAELKLAGPVNATDPTQLIQGGLSIPKQGETHTAWSVQANAPGTTEFTLTGSTGTESDAMRLPLPILEDGFQQLTAASGRLAPAAKKFELKLELPTPLDPKRTHVTLQLTPSHAAVIFDALPYLVDYPYGCVEQTMSRFLPAVIAQKTLTDLGLSAADLEQRILAGESLADAKRRAGTAGLAKLDEVVQKSLDRLSDAQQSDGGFGWWPGAHETNLWMTAYVSWGLGVAKTAGIAVPAYLEGGTQRALVRALTDENGVTDEHAWALAALSGTKLENDEPAKVVAAAFARVFAAREKLSATGRACLAQAAVKLGTDDQRAVLLRNLENGAERVRADNLGDTVHWGKTSNYWSAMDGAVEATSLTLLALLELDPQHPLIEPAMNWLVLNRRSAHWQSTRDSAFAVLALTKYIALRGELGGEQETEVFASGKSVGRVKLNRDSVLKGATTLDIPAALLRPGTNTLTLKRVSGTGPLYAVALTSAWATGDTVKPAGHLVDVTRGFIRQKTEPTLIGTLRITPQPLPSGSSAVAGEQVTAKVTLTAPNDLEYVMIEVPKPAGCEPLNPLSGWDAKICRAEKADPAKKDDEDSGLAIYREERDDKSVFFLEKLEAGTWEIRYGLRAVTPGNFRALPVQATAMYVPEITANSDAQRVKIVRSK